MMTSAVVSLLQFPLLTAAIDGGREGRDAVNVGCAMATLACVPYTLWQGLNPISYPLNPKRVLTLIARAIIYMHFESSFLKLNGIL